MKTGNELLDKFIKDLQNLIRDLMVGMIDQQLENEAERRSEERRVGKECRIRSRKSPSRKRKYCTKGTGRGYISQEEN